MNNLKRCPFCNSNAQTYVDYDTRGGGFVVSAYVECSNCGVRKRAQAEMKNATFMEWYSLFEQAENAWNERAIET